MSTKTPHDDLLCRVLSGPLTPELSGELDDWLREDPQHPELFAQFLVLEDMIVAVRKESSAESILSLLLEMEEKAVPISYTQMPDRSLREKVAVFIRDRHVKHFALAACVVIAASGFLWALGAIIASNDQSGTPGEAGQQAHPDETLAPAELAVATLTATHNARWAESPAERALARGAELHPGTRLTLTAGFAVITTNSGAVAILEAPAAIELLDNDNALRLHSGKLVGICETESARGFSVLTEHARITDLGTVFGVEFSHGTTRTTVFAGEVAVAAVNPESSETQSVYLTQGQSAQVDHLARIEWFTPAPQSSFVRQWQAIAQPPQVAGQIEYRPSLPASLAMDAAESNLLQLFPEATGVQVDSTLRATLTETGKHITFASQNAQPIGETHVDAYLVHYDFKVGGGDAKAPRRATIRFDRPILGVIADEKLLFASDPLFAPVGMDFGPSVNPRDPELPTGRGLEPKLSLPGDIVEISEDRLTLTVELYGAMAVDQLRVLVQATEPAAQ